MYKDNTKSIFAGEKISYLCITELLNLVESSFANAVKSAVLNFMDDWLNVAMINDNHKH